MIHHYLSEEMKENMNTNIMHAVPNPKSYCEKQTKSNKRQPFINSHQPNQSRPIKKNAYIVDSDSETSPSKTTPKHFEYPPSIDSVSQIIASLSKQSSIQSSPSTQHSNPLSTCQTHSQPVYSYNFCIQCSQYLICPSCVKQTHANHIILTLGTEQQTKSMTKQFLIEKIQHTLHKLKSKENDIKNKSCEMELILSNVKRMEHQLINKLQNVFREIADIVRTVYEKETILYERKIEEFYQKYNEVGDELRENLLTIIDESFQLSTFQVSSVCKDPPTIPDQHIKRLKLALEKTKSFYRSVMESIDELKGKVVAKAVLVSGVKGVNGKRPMRKEGSTQKYEKFLSDTCYQEGNSDQTSKSSLIKILDTLSK